MQKVSTALVLGRKGTPLLAGRAMRIHPTFTGSCYRRGCWSTSTRTTPDVAIAVGIVVHLAGLLLLVVLPEPSLLLLGSQNEVRSHADAEAFYVATFWTLSSRFDRHLAPAVVLARGLERVLAIGRVATPARSNACKPLKSSSYCASLGRGALGEKENFGKRESQR